MKYLITLRYLKCTVVTWANVGIAADSPMAGGPEGPAMSVVADLHVHTTVSDGRLTIPQAVAAAKAAGISVIAITDHDRLHPALQTPVSTRAGVTIIHGIELRVETAAGIRVDLLGYGAERTVGLLDMLDGVQSDRHDRAADMIAAIEAHESIDLEVPLRPGIGRPHIAAAVAAHPETPHSYQDVFDRLIGEGKPCYVRRTVPRFEDGLAALRTACRVVGLAHPFRYSDPEAALALTPALDAVERWYPYRGAVDSDHLKSAIERHSLLETGGSDTHDEAVGRCGVPAGRFGPLREPLLAADES